MRHAIRAFTLVELLVAIGIIAVLISLLLPVLGKAKRASHDGVCLSNLKQIGAGWALYDNDFDAFPWGDAEEYSVRFGWGGVHWYGFDTEGNPIYPDHDAGENLLTASRPVNPYLGHDVTTRAFAKTFRCPSDDGISIPGAADFGLPTDPWAALGVDGDTGDEHTVFGKLGTSYEANDAMYRRVLNGEGQYGPFFGARDVHVNPSRFVIVGDAGAMTIAESGLYQEVSVQGWWHGFGRGQMAFLDGSARHEEVIGESLGYTFYRLP